MLGGGGRTACHVPATRHSEPSRYLVKGRHVATGVTDTHRSPPASWPGSGKGTKLSGDTCALRPCRCGSHKPGQARVACWLPGERKVTLGANTHGGRGASAWLTTQGPGATGPPRPGRAGGGYGVGVGAWLARHWNPDASGRLQEGDGTLDPAISHLFSQGTCSFSGTVIFILSHRPLPAQRKRRKDAENNYGMLPSGQ